MITKTGHSEEALRAKRYFSKQKKVLKREILHCEEQIRNARTEIEEQQAIVESYNEDIDWMKESISNYEKVLDSVEFY